MIYLTGHWIYSFKGKYGLVPQHQGNGKQNILKVQDKIDLVIRWEETEQSLWVWNSRMNGLSPLLYLPEILGWGVT